VGGAGGLGWGPGEGEEGDPAEDRHAITRGRGGEKTGGSTSGESGGGGLGEKHS